MFSLHFITRLTQFTQVTQLPSATVAAAQSVLDVKVNPDAGQLPGGPQIQQLLDGLAGWALFAALGGLLLSTIVWAVGSQGGNHHAISRGKTGVLVCAGAALIAGGAAPIINFFADLGSQIR